MKKHIVRMFVTQARSRLANCFHFRSMPLLSRCYCEECKNPLSDPSILDERFGWCPKCKGVVATSLFQVPSWAMGGVVFLFAAMLL